MRGGKLDMAAHQGVLAKAGLFRQIGGPMITVTFQAQAPGCPASHAARDFRTE
jgi:hypothetical protein